MSIYIKYLSKYKFLFITAVICVALEAVCDLMGPTLMSRIVNFGIEKKSMDAVLFWGGMMLLVTLTGAVFAIIRNYLASYVSQRVGADLRSDLFQKVLKFSEESADRLESGSLITRMTNDTSQAVQFINGIMRVFMKAPIIGTGSIILASLLNIRLSLFIYGVVAVVGCLVYISMKLSYERFYMLQRAIDSMNMRVQEFLLGIRLVKAFGTHDREQDKFQKTNENLMKTGIRSQMIITVISPLLTLVVGIATVGVLYFGSVLFKKNLAETGDITAFTIYMAQILTALIMITNIFNVFVRTKASTARIREVFEAGEDAAAQKVTKENLGPGKLEFSHFTFSYPSGSGEAALTDVSFTLEAGETLAIIGPTGSGKSTIVWLILGFYLPDSGSIRYGDTVIDSEHLVALRNTIGVVPQKPVILSATVRDNILFGNANATEEEMEAAVAAAKADFIYKMEQGLDSLLGSGGVNISGGQKQRVSLARALVRHAPVLILDDATSALDAVTEQDILRQLEVLEHGISKILITQRCSTAMNATRILVMEDGKVQGYGRHEELLQNCESYREIYRSQLEGYMGGDH